MLAIRLPEEIEARLENLARHTSRSKTFHAREAIFGNLDDPRSIGEALKGSELANSGNNRIGAWRLICEIQDEKILIIVLGPGNRR